jgi:hypothetical protein
MPGGEEIPRQALGLRLVQLAAKVRKANAHGSEFTGNLPTPAGISRRL